MPKTFRQCEIVSRLEDNDGKVLFDIENMKQVLAERTCISKYAYIIHDRDIYTVEDEQKNPKHKAGELKPEHIHLVLKFKTPQQIEYIAKWFGISPNFIQNIIHNWISSVRYLIHLNNKDKFQYSLEDVTSSFVVEEEIANSESGENINDIVERIIAGEIKEYEKYSVIEPITLVRYATQIKEAFKVYRENYLHNNRNRNIKSIYICGTSGSGKTTLAKKLCEDFGYSYFISSGSNDPFDNYSGEEAVILDDIRPSAMPLADLLKILDPNTSSSVKSRYHNKVLMAKLIIITTILPMQEFFQQFYQEDEPIEQLCRRCSTYIRMSQERIYISTWDKEKSCYSKEREYKNKIIEEYEKKESQKEEDLGSRLDDFFTSMEANDGIKERDII